MAGYKRLKRSRHGRPKGAVFRPRPPPIAVPSHKRLIMKKWEVIDSQGHKHTVRLDANSKFTLCTCDEHEYGDFPTIGAAMQFLEEVHLKKIPELAPDLEWKLKREISELRQQKFSDEAILEHLSFQWPEVPEQQLRTLLA